MKTVGNYYRYQACNNRTKKTEQTIIQQKLFWENLLAIEIKNNKTPKNKTKIKHAKPVDFGVSVLRISEIVMYEFCYNYIKPKSGDIAAWCYLDTYSSIVYIKLWNVYTSIL